MGPGLVRAISELELQGKLHKRYLLLRWRWVGGRVGGGWGIIKGVPLVGGRRWGPGPTCGRCMSVEHPVIDCFCFVCKLVASGREGEAGFGLS